VEVTYKLDLSGVLHVSAQHLPSGTSAAVQIANSPYRLTALRRSAARTEVEQLRAGAGEGAAVDTATESDLALAMAMVARARRAIERGTDDATALDRVKASLVALNEAVEKKAPDTADRTDALSDALLDLV
jgi:molecular chaperone DnaK